MPDKKETTEEKLHKLLDALSPEQLELLKDWYNQHADEIKGILTVK